jgi:Holliday junction DNA helicase RuvA
MISYLKGVLADLQKPGNHKIIVTLDVNQVGYDLQVVPARQLASNFLPSGKPCSCSAICKFAMTRSSCSALANREERELFRQLIGVSGIGPQMALAFA